MIPRLEEFIEFYDVIPYALILLATSSPAVIFLSWIFIIFHSFFPIFMNIFNGYSFIRLFVSHSFLTVLLPHFSCMSPYSPLGQRNQLMNTFLSRLRLSIKNVSTIWTNARFDWRCWLHHSLLWGYDASPADPAWVPLSTPSIFCFLRSRRISWWWNSRSSLRAAQPHQAPLEAASPWYFPLSLTPSCPFTSRSGSY